MGSADAQALQGREQGRSAAAVRPGDRAPRAATRTLAVTAGRTMRRDEAARWQLIRRRERLERGDGCRDPDVAGAWPHARPERELRAARRAADGAASAGAGRRWRPSPRSGQPVSLARGCVRLACLAQPGAQGAARRLDIGNGEDPPRPAGASSPRPRRPLDAGGVGCPGSVEHLAVRNRPSAFRAPAGPAGPRRRWNMVERRTPPAPGARRRPRVTSKRFGALQ